MMALRLRLREEADHWLSKASADTVEEKILLAKSSLDAGVSEHASRLANELFATLGRLFGFLLATPADRHLIPELLKHFNELHHATGDELLLIAPSNHSKPECSSSTKF